MFLNAELRSRDRCELYIGGLLLLVSAAFTIPPLLSLIGFPLAIELAVTLMVAGLEGLLYVSLLGMVALPVLY